jgi:hypothetical protein
LPKDYSKMEEAWAELFKISLLDLKLWKKVSSVKKINRKRFLGSCYPFIVSNLSRKSSKRSPRKRIKKNFLI